MNNKLFYLAYKYARDVISEKEITTWEVKWEAERFIKDYENRQYDDEFEYYLDKAEIKKVNDLLKLMNYPTGYLAGEQVLEHIAPFQAFFLTNIFGWRFKENKRKFRYSDLTLFIARKNGKTWLIGTVFLILMLTEQEHSEFYSICLTKELAAEIKKIMAQIISASPVLTNRFTVSTTQTGRITCNLTNNFFEPRVSEAGKNNSIRPSAFVSDEHGNFVDNSNFTAMASGQKNVINPLVFRTTTAYAINNSIMEYDLEYIRSVYKGVVEDERMFALLYYAEDENIWNDTGMYQANPLRLEENYEIIREERKKAEIQVNLQEEYITKSMNVFMQQNSDKKYLDIDLFKKGKISYEEFKEKVKGKSVFLGVDLSVSTDLTAVSIVFKDKDKYYIHSKGFLPKDTLIQREEKIDYYLYERQGYCDLHQGIIVNYNEIEDYIRSIEDKYQCRIEKIVSDPYNATQTMLSLAEDYSVLLITQSYKVLSPPLKAFRDQVYKDNVYYSENKLLEWCVSNAIEKKGNYDDILITKNRDHQRIDLLDAAIFAFSEAEKGEGIDLNSLAEEYLDSLEEMGW